MAARLLVVGRPQTVGSRKSSNTKDHRRVLLLAGHDMNAPKHQGVRSFWLVSLFTWCNNRLPKMLFRYSSFYFPFAEFLQR